MTRDSNRVISAFHQLDISLHLYHHVFNSTTRTDLRSDGTSTCGNYCNFPGSYQIDCVRTYPQISVFYLTSIIKPTSPDPKSSSTSAPAHPSGSAPAIKPTSAADAHDQVVTPWDVQGSVSTDGKQLAIDYDKLIDQFGTRRLDATILERFERLTGHKPHVFLRRGMFFSHRYVRIFVSLRDFLGSMLILCT